MMSAQIQKWQFPLLEIISHTQKPPLALPDPPQGAPWTDGSLELPPPKKERFQPPEIPFFLLLFLFSRKMNLELEKGSLDFRDSAL
jgi:hypothetical protein